MATVKSDPFFRERERKPKILRQIKFINNLEVIANAGLEQKKGQLSIILSVLQFNFVDRTFDSRELCEAVAAHPEFKCPRAKAGIGRNDSVSPGERVVCLYLSQLRRLGLIETVKETDGKIRNQARRNSATE